MVEWTNGTTYSCVGVFLAGTGEVEVLKDAKGHKCIPSVVAFKDGRVLTGYEAVAQADHNPSNTLYDAKRFIGKKFSPEELNTERPRYPFKIQLDDEGMVYFVVGPPNNLTNVRPEEVGAHLLRTLRQTAIANLSSSVTKTVMSVPAEFVDMQKNFTKKAASLAGLEVLRVISEPTAAAMAYGLHKKQNVQSVMVVDLGGGTLDVSLLMVQGGMFFTQAMAGNNHLGGQDFNQRLMSFLRSVIEKESNRVLTDPEDLQALRLVSEEVKLKLTTDEQVEISVPLQSTKSTFKYSISREKFEEVNLDLFKKVLQPIEMALQEAEMSKNQIDEVVLVGGSTRVPKIRQLIGDYFGKEPNTAVDPELAVAFGVGIQAGILGGMWPLQVSAIELPTNARKIHVY
ncbi:hypothetical protein CAPTEDRAFT_221120 [Capitella teleta]|uniref:Heat shock 70 kDa protein 13 n=1 Tax=Capitella teleta TaxID=283909 RepID=R7U2P6_CAPTE|nr:hypothetical protein CAPTEDRAFT_221120 [Capitella teleta]|eukprot:ELU00381.1 hypothetical protein CAPTEDRAFT_221120 [Capitella teleta]